MIFATAVASLGIFVVALWSSGVVGAAAGVLTTTQGAVATMRDQSLDDAAREKASRRASIRLLSDFASILIRGALALAASLLPIWFVDMTGFASSNDVFAFLARWDVLLIATGVMVLVYVARIRLWPSS